MQEEGYVAAILYPDGAKDIELGKIVAVIVENKDDIDAFKNYTADSAAAPSAPAQQAAPADPTPAASTPAAASAPAQATAASSGDRIFVSPLAKRLAEEKGIAIDQVQGSGPGGRIIAADVEEFKAPAAAPA